MSGGWKRPWPPAERKAVWFDLFDPAGRRMGMLFGADRVDEWARRRPGVWWGVIHWYDGAIECRYRVRANVKRFPGMKRRRVIWRAAAAKKGGERGQL